MLSKITTIRGSGTIAKALKPKKFKGLNSLIVERRTQDDDRSILTDTDTFFSSYFLHLCSQNYNLGQFRR